LFIALHISCRRASTDVQFPNSMLSKQWTRCKSRIKGRHFC